MTAHRMRSRLARVLTMATFTALVASIAIASTALADAPGGSKLSKLDRERLATATANGSSNVTMLFATVEGSTGSVASALAALGAAARTGEGRAIKTGILALGVDLGHPALQTTSAGERKVIDWLTFTDPLTDGDPSWINMNQTVSVVGGSFTVGTRTWTGAPD